MIIFDLDGTLWNTLEATQKAAFDVAKQYNIIDFDISRVEAGMGLSRKENLVNYYPNYSEEEATFFINNVNKLTREYIKNNYVNIYNGVNDTIIELSKKYKLGIITNNNDEYVKTFLNISGLENYFCDYMGATTYGITKQEAIKRMVEKHNEKFNVYVGDIKKDMEAALGANIEFIYAKYGFGKDFEYKYYINDIKNLLNLIK